MVIRAWNKKRVYVIILSEQKTKLKRAPRMNVTDLDSFKQDHGYISVDHL